MAAPDMSGLVAAVDFTTVTAALVYVLALYLVVEVALVAVRMFRDAINGSDGMYWRDSEGFSADDFLSEDEYRDMNRSWSRAKIRRQKFF